ncbi:MAG: dihydropteroate synthase, partial [Kiritimatiellia bacterium]
ARHECLPVPMLNSVSLERKEAIDLAVRHGAPVVASAAGEHDLPCDTDGRLDNLARLMGLLQDAGMGHGLIHIDPLVLPIATDSRNALGFLEAVRAVRGKYGPAIHIVGGFSNVSFGMPCRKLINAVFTRLALEAGADGGIVDPFQINLRALDQLDPAEPDYVMAQRLL